MIERNVKNLKEVDEKTMKDVYANIVKAILVIFYFLIVNLAYENVNIETLNRGIQLFTMIFLFITIFIFEISYKKDDTKLAIEGIELLVLSFITLTIDHVITKYHFELKPYALVISYVYAIYFILKGIVNDKLLLSIPVILTSMPIATNAAIMANKYKANESLASQLVFLSALLSIITIPFISFLFIR